MIQNCRVGSLAPISIRRHASPVLRTQSHPNRQRLALTPVRALHKSGFFRKPNWQPYRLTSENSTDNTTLSEPELPEIYQDTSPDSLIGIAIQKIEGIGLKTPIPTNTFMLSSLLTSIYQRTGLATPDIVGFFSNKIQQTSQTLIGIRRSENRSRTKTSS